MSPYVATLLLVGLLAAVTGAGFCVIAASSVHDELDGRPVNPRRVAHAARVFRWTVIAAVAGVPVSVAAVALFWQTMPS